MKDPTSLKRAATSRSKPADLQRVGGVPSPRIGPGGRPTTRQSAPADPGDGFAEQIKREHVMPKKPVLLDLKPARYLTVVGRGAPGGAEFQARIGALYAVAFTVKMTRKFAGQPDYPVAKLEARYLHVSTSQSKEDWEWQLMIRTPELIGSDELVRAVEALRKRGKEGDAALVALETLDEGSCVQMVHVGPYDREGETVALMEAFAKTKGLAVTGLHHEIYVSDPRRVAPEKLKTILRLPVGAASP